MAEGTINYAKIIYNCHKFCEFFYPDYEKVFVNAALIILISFGSVHNCVIIINPLNLLDVTFNFNSIEKI